MDDPAVADDQARLEGLGAREGEGARAQRPDERGDRWVVGVQHRPVLGVLLGEEALLGLPVALARAVAREVIVREVDPDRHARLEVAHRLELVAGDLSHQDIGIALDQANEWLADVPAHRGAQARGLEDLAHQGGGGGLAVGAGDGDHGHGSEAVGELDLADHLDPVCLGRLEDREVAGDPRAHDDEVRVETGARVAPRLDLHPCGDLRQHRRKLRGGAHVAQDHLGALRAERLGHGDAGAGDAQDGDSLVLPVGHGMVLCGAVRAGRP
ncbi:hypothetical protein D3C87_1472600 [compost metagenome]